MKKILILFVLGICLYAAYAKAQTAPVYYEQMRRNQERQRDDTYYDYKGFSYQKSGNTIYKNNGTAYYKSGNQISGSDGSRYEQSGDVIYHNGREKCRVKGKYVICR